MIAAMGKNNVIGIDNSLPWKLPADMKRFKQITSGKPVIMGRKTFESIGRPLPNRKNIILTRDKNYSVEGCIIVTSVEEAITHSKDANEAMVIGGEQVFRLFLPHAKRLYLTFIEEEFKGDSYFPQFNKEEWTVLKEEHYQDDHKYSFVDFERK